MVLRTQRRGLRVPQQVLLISNGVQPLHSRFSPSSRRQHETWQYPGSITTSTGRIARTREGGCNCLPRIVPSNRPIHLTDFGVSSQSCQCRILFEYFSFLCYAFSSRYIDTSQRFSRVAVDSFFFTVLRNRFGCPAFELANERVDHPVDMFAFPQEVFGIIAFASGDFIFISPNFEGGSQVQDLVRIATKPSSTKELTQPFESGWADYDRR
jgi:hypothetical protein